MDGIVVDGGRDRGLLIHTLRLERVKQVGPGERGKHETAGAEAKQDEAALAIDQGDSDEGHDGVEELDDQVAFGREADGEAGLLQNDDQKAEQGIDAGGLVADEDGACER